MLGRNQTGDPRSDKTFQAAGPHEQAAL